MAVAQAELFSLFRSTTSCVTQGTKGSISLATIGHNLLQPDQCECHFTLNFWLLSFNGVVTTAITAYLLYVF